MPPLQVRSAYRKLESWREKTVQLTLVSTTFSRLKPEPASAGLSLCVLCRQSTSGGVHSIRAGGQLGFEDFVRVGEQPVKDMQLLYQLVGEPYEVEQTKVMAKIEQPALIS